MENGSWNRVDASGVSDDDRLPSGALKGMPDVPLWKKLNPQERGFSPKLTALIGAILGHDYGVRDRKGGRLGPLSITSDGYVTAYSTASDGGGAFIGDVHDLVRNIDMLLDDVKLNKDEQNEFARLWSKNVTDWRSDRSVVPKVIKPF